MGSMTQGVVQGLAIRAQRERTEELRKIQDRQELFKLSDMLKSVALQPAGKVKELSIRKILGPLFKNDPDTLNALSKMNEEEMQAQGEAMDQLMVDNPGIGRKGLEALVQSGKFGIPEMWKMSQEAKERNQKETLRTMRASVMQQGAGGGETPAAPAMPDTDLRTGPSGEALGMAPSPPPVQAAPQPMAAQAPAAPPAQDDDQAEVARLNSVEDQTLGQIDRLMQMGEGISEGEKRGFDAKLHALEKRRSAILNAPGITADLAGPNGEPLVVLHTKSGAWKAILGRKPVNLDFIDGVDPKDGSPAKLAVDKNTGKTSVIGKLPPKEPGTIEERLAVAERFAQANPQDPRAQANLAQAQRGVAIKKELIGEQAEATARGTKKAALETPERPNQSVIKEFAEYDSTIASVANLMKAVADPEIQQVLGMSPDAFARRKSTKATAAFVTTKQIDYMAELANTVGELRRVLVGQAQTNPEMKNLLPLLPKDSDPVKIQHGKLQAIARGIERIRDKHAEGLESVNIMVPGERGRGGPGRGAVKMSDEDKRLLDAGKANAAALGQAVLDATDRVRALILPRLKR